MFTKGSKFFVQWFLTIKTKFVVWEITIYVTIQVVNIIEQIILEMENVAKHYPMAMSANAKPLYRNNRTKISFCQALCPNCHAKKTRLRRRIEKN